MLDYCPEKGQGRDISGSNRTIESNLIKSRIYSQYCGTLTDVEKYGRKASGAITQGEGEWDERFGKRRGDPIVIGSCDPLLFRAASISISIHLTYR